MVGGDYILFWGGGVWGREIGKIGWQKKSPNESKPFTGIPIKLVIEKYCLSDVLWRYTCAEWAWWLIEPKWHQIWSLLCWTNKHVKVISVLLPCFWIKSHDNKWLFPPFCLGNTYFNTIHSVYIVRCIVPGARVNVEHNLHRNLCKMGWYIVRVYPRGTPTLLRPLVSYMHMTTGMFPVISAQQPWFSL